MSTSRFIESVNPSSKIPTSISLRKLSWIVSAAPISRPTGFQGFRGATSRNGKNKNFGELQEQMQRPEETIKDLKT